MSGSPWSSAVSAAYDRYLDPPESIEADDCRNCGAGLCADCGRCQEPDRNACLRTACECPGYEVRREGIPQDAWERALDDAIDDARVREDQ